MRNEAARNADVRKLGELVDGIEVAMLTTLAADGKLVSRPLATLEIDADGDLWFFTAADTGKVDELQADPHVNLAYADPDSNRYVSVSGTASLVRDRERIESLWHPAAKVYFPKGEDDPNLVALRVRPETAEYWEGPSSFVGKALAFARARVEGDVSKLGENERMRLRPGH